MDENRLLIFFGENTFLALMCGAIYEMVFLCSMFGFGSPAFLSSTRFLPQVIGPMSLHSAFAGPLFVNTRHRQAALLVFVFFHVHCTVFSCSSVLFSLVLLETELLAFRIEPWCR